MPIKQKKINNTTGSSLKKKLRIPKSIGKSANDKKDLSDKIENTKKLKIKLYKSAFLKGNA